MSDQPKPDKIYISGSARLRCKNPDRLAKILALMREAPQGERVMLCLSADVEKTSALMDQHGKTAKNGRRYFNYCVTARREDSEWGDNMTTWVDQYEPKQQDAPADAPATPDKPDLPF